MANYDQHRDDEDRDYRSRHPYSDSSQPRPGNYNRDEQRNSQPYGGRFQQSDEDTRGKSGRYGYSGSSSDQDDDHRFRGGMERNYLAEGYDESRFRQPGGQNQNNPNQRRQDPYRGDYDRYDQARRDQPHDQDRSRRSGSVLDTPNQGNRYGQQPYYSGSDPRSYGREGQYGSQQPGQYGQQPGQQYGGQQRGQNQYGYGASHQQGQYGSQPGMNRNRYEQHDEHRSGQTGRQDNYRGGQGINYNQGAPSAGSYSQNFNDRDENSRYRANRAPEDRYDDHGDRRHHDQEHRGIIGRITDWFSGDDDDHNDYRRR